MSRHKPPTLPNVVLTLSMLTSIGSCSLPKKVKKLRGLKIFLDI